MSNQELLNISVKDLVHIIIAVLIIALFLKLFFVETLKISSSSMEEKLLPGDFVLVNKLYYDIKIPGGIPLIDSGSDRSILKMNNPKKGDIIAFYFREPNTEKPRSFTLVKRCIALPGDSVFYNNKQIVLPKKGDVILLNSVNQDKSLLSLIEKDGNDIKIINDTTIIINNERSQKYIFKNDFYFFVGDNFLHSYDSRSFGPIPRKDIIGKVVLVYWSLSFDKMAKSIFSRIRWNRLGMVV